MVGEGNGRGGEREREKTRYQLPVILLDFRPKFRTSYHKTVSSLCFCIFHVFIYTSAVEIVVVSRRVQGFEEFSKREQ